MTEKPYPQNHPHYIQGVYAERERIIALLEAELADIYNTGDEWHEGYRCASSTAIALIKGENE